MTGPVDGGFHVHTGVLRQHAKDVAVVEHEFRAGTSAILQESIVTDVAFGVLWSQAVVPGMTATQIALHELCGKVGQGLHDQGIRIDATADVYDKGESTSKGLVERAKPDVEGVGDVLTNDTSINFGKDVAAGKPFDPEGVSAPDGGVFDRPRQIGVMLGKLATGQPVDPLDALGLAGDIAFDALGFALNPLGTVVGAFVGEIIDAIPPLKETLDLTLGDPDAIGKAAQSWDTLAKWFVDCGDRYQESLKTVTEEIWHGGAADQYRSNAENAIAGLDEIGRCCEAVSAVVLVLGSIVGDVRGKLVGDAIGFVIEQAVSLAIAMSTAAPTFGASVVAFWEVFDVDAEIKMAAAALQIEQGLMHLAIGVGKAVEQEQAFKQYEAKLAS